MRCRPIAIALFTLLLFSSCSTHDRSDIAVPEATAESFHPVGVPPDIRSYGDEADFDVDELIRDYRATLRKFPKNDGFNILTLSGGGPDGAFGAGVLAGWTKSGTRPSFDMVTGVSTGAIIAPFAFLGPDYDLALARFYTQTRTREIARFRVLGALLDGGYVADTAPLEQTIERELTDEMIAEIGREAAKGRVLLVSTTNIDAERPVIWDIGALAMQGTPEANTLIRKVILASASIPILFKPVPIRVTDGVDIREELHVDGGLTQEVFVYPHDVPMRRILRETGFDNRRNTVWLIQNKKVWPEYIAQSTRLPRLAARTVNLLIKSQTIGDIGQIAILAKRDGLHMHALTIPPEFEQQSTELFDPVYMKALYEQGYALGQDRNSWFRDVQTMLE